MHFSKHPLDFKEYENYGIDQKYSAFTYEYLNIDQNQADDIESDLQTQGYKIFHSNLSRVQNNLFKLEIIIAKLDFVF